MRAAPGKARTVAPQRIAAITLDERTVVRRSPAIEHERATAITDLLRDNRFTPQSGRAGPVHLYLAIEENRLAIEIRTPGSAPGDEPGETIVLPLAPFRRIVKDYFLVCESYYEAIRGNGLARVEAIDMGRRSPTAPRRSPRSTRSSGRATPMSPRPSGASSAGSGST